MDIVLARIKAFGLFWYDFIVGDDWSIAAGVIAILAITWGLNKADFALDWLFLVLAILGLLSLCVRRGMKPNTA